MRKVLKAKTLFAQKVAARLCDEDYEVWNLRH
jgi:hypothetical protein